MILNNPNHMNHTQYSALAGSSGQWEVITKNCYIDCDQCTAPTCVKTVHLEHNSLYISYSGVQDTTRYVNFYDRQGDHIGWFVWDIRLGMCAFYF